MGLALNEAQTSVRDAGCEYFDLLGYSFGRNYSGAGLSSHYPLLLMDSPNLLNTSWWSHPKARFILAVSSELADHPDVLLTELLHRKGTFVYRSL
jgi:hypothetical protein